MIANAHTMSDEQRKAMWARMRGGGSIRPHGEASHEETGDDYGTASPIILSNPSSWELFKAGVDGFFEGFKGGASILTDKLTFGLSDATGLTESDQYQGKDYEFSRGAATVARESLLTAAGIGALGKVRAAWQGTRYAATEAAKHIPTISTVAGFGAKSLIDDYREANPALNPYADKGLAMASQLAGYVGSIGLIGAAGQYGGALLRSTGLAGIGKAALGKLDSALATFGKTITKPLPAGFKTTMGKLHSAYSLFSDFTGSSIKELGAAVKAPSNLARVRSLFAKAASATTRASMTRITAGQEAAALRKAAQSAFTAYTKATGPRAGVLYKQAVRLQWQASDALQKGAEAAKTIAKAAGDMAAKATAIQTKTLAGLKKAAYVAGMVGGVETRDELAIREYQRKAAEAISKGRPMNLPQDTARTAAGTLGALAIGTTGNPIEKLFRPGLAAHQAAIGAYRAGYEALRESAQREGWTDAELQTELERHAKTKPRDIAGKGIWQVAPAAAAFVNWKAGEALSRAKRSTIDVRPAGSYADADTLHVKGGTIRMSDMNAPEVAHGAGANTIERNTGEFLGEESAARIRKLVKEGQYVRLVEDSSPKAGGTDKYGRMVRTVETLPKPFDQLLRVPYLGKIIPARDVNKTLIREGLADIHYRELSGRPDRAEEYDRTRAKAQEEKRGIWSDYAQGQYAEYAKQHPTFEPWVGTEKTVAERQAAEYLKKTGRTRPDAVWGDRAQMGGLGLMATGNSGIFGMLPRSGSLAAQTWNAALAAIGALEFNERARRTIPRMTRPIKAIRTESERWIANIRMMVAAQAEAAQ